MIAKGVIIDRIQSLIQDYSTETEAKLLDHLNSAYMDMAADHPWEELIRKVNLTSNVLPADLERIIYVEDGEDKLYFKSGFPQRYGSNRLYNYFKNIVVTTPSATGSDMVTTANSTSVTSAAASFTSALIGEYIRIGTNRGIYKITAVPSTTSLTLEKGFKGASSTAQYYEVRPTGTKQVFFYDNNGDEITSFSTVNIWYLQRPLPLYNDYDQIHLPGEADALRIKTLQLHMIADKYDNDSLRQAGNFEDAYAKMKSRSQLPERFVMPRDKFGQRVAFGRIRKLTVASIHSERFY